MPPISRRVVLRLFLAPFVGAALTAGQVVLSERVGMSELGDDFTAGNDRMLGVPITVTAWFFALAVPLTVLILGRGVGVRGRIAIAVLAAPAVLAVAPLVNTYTNPAIADSVQAAAREGVVIALIFGLIAAAVPPVGTGIAVHASAWWLTATISSLVWSRVVAYAGLVEVLDIEQLRALGFGDYHSGHMVPSILLTLLLSCVVAGWVAHSARTFPRAVAAGVACPLLAAVSYTAGEGQSLLWNGTARLFVFLTAAAALILTTVVAATVRIPARCRAASVARKQASWRCGSAGRPLGTPDG